MLIKLLKYDFRSLRRYCIPLLFAMLAGTVLGMICLPLVYGLGDVLPNVAEEFSFLFAMGMMFSLFGCLGAFFLILLSAGLFQLMVCVDFYKSLITDEGYLTFTLPVKRREIIFSKVINGVLWCLIGVVSAIVSVLLVLGSLALFTDASFPSLDLWQTMFGTDGTDFGEVLIALQMLLYGFLSLVSGLLLYFAAIFLGSVIARKNKLIVGIGCILAGNFIYSTVLSILMMILEFVTIAFGVALGLGESFLMFQIIFGVMNVVMLAATVALYFFLHRMMERRLNLA